MSRAGLVAGLGLLVWYYGRKTHPFVLLSFAAAVTLIVNPSYLWGDLGWYLSFGAFIGVIVLAPLIHRYFWGLAEAGTLRGLLVETSGSSDEVVKIMPPLTITDEQLQRGIALLDEAVRAATA